MFAVYNELKKDEMKRQFTIGIVDDVTNLSLPEDKNCPNTAAPGTIECKFWGLGGDGTVGANKNSIKIIGETTDMYCQAYFEYDTKKSFGITKSHLRFGKHPISSTYYVSRADFVACHNQTYLTKYDIISELKPHGSFLLNCEWTEDQLEQHIPGDTLRYIAENDIHFYIIDANKESQALGLGNRSNMVLQAAFFKLANVIPVEDAVAHMKDAVKKTYGLKGEKVVNMNIAAVDAGINALVEVKVKPEWTNLTGKALKPADESLPYVIKNILVPINAQKGDDLPVSAFKGMEDGTMPLGTSKYEKRGIATHLPVWDAAECLQCNMCSFVCPHAVIRPFLLDEGEVKAAPVDMTLVDAKGPGLAGLKYTMGVSTLDCTSCGSCVASCPKSGKALKMVPTHEVSLDQTDWNFLTTVKEKTSRVDKFTLKGSQFKQPLVEFNGACAGCGETPYIKAITQLFGDKMMVANATGCTSIYSGSAPSTPYCTNAQGQGPAWANSLFEDNAEFGLGMHVGVEKQRDKIQHLMERAIAECTKCSDELKGVMKEWIEARGSSARSAEVSARLVPMMEACGCDTCKEILAMKDLLVKKSQWIIGGDGWGYDIGYGGVDHVLASGMDVNILIVDTEVYSNTGGQSSKATPVGAVAKFASSGKRIRKKDIGAMAMTYGYVYVAQVSIGASQMQLFNVLKEAEAYPGPSLVIAYAPCINHGIKGGMTRTQTVGKEAVACGYWHLWHYNPELAEQGKNPFVLDSKEPDWSKFQEFLMKEVRYTSLKKAFPAEADELFRAAEENAKWRYNNYKRLSMMEY